MAPLPSPHHLHPTLTVLLLFIATTSTMGLAPTRITNPPSSLPSVVGKGSPRFRSFAEFIIRKQEEILAAVEAEDGSGARFARDPWTKDGGSFGLTTCLEDGALVEKGAASVSIVYGTLTEDRAKAMSGRRSQPYRAGQGYQAAALSLVFHSRSPMVPTFRADVRYFEVAGEEGGEEGGEAASCSGWFGGGADLTPYYLFDEDCRDFHDCYERLCSDHEASSSSPPPSSGGRLYADLKQRCDDYFMLPARGERRGVGGIFFDDLTSLVPTDGGAFESKGAGGQEGLDDAQQFTEAVADAWMGSWLPICRKRREAPFSEAQRDWQLMRRGRYLEFNLLYDRGVRFGLVPGGRTEAVMVSAPPLIRWKFNHVPEPGSEEQRLVDVLRSPIEWATTSSGSSSSRQK